MKEKFIVVGDIHGCLDQLNEILDSTKKYKGYKYIFLGDYIDRGPDSEGVIDRIKEIDAVFLKGNHEEMVFEATKNLTTEYFEDLFSRIKISNKSLSWLKSTTVIKFETESYFFVHAGLDINKTMAEQTERDYLWIREESDYHSITAKTVIHGHTIVDFPETAGNRININTGCGVNGFLTALVLPDMKYYRSSQSPGIELDWNRIKKELEEEMLLYDNFGSLEEIADE